MMNVFNKMTDAENIRAGDPYDDPAFERLAREHDVWGRAESALCAVFWLAGKVQPPSGQSAAPVGAPDRIFLVIGEDVTPDTPFSQLAEVTWCADRVNDTDIEYVRAQPAAATVPAGKDAPMPAYRDEDHFHASASTPELAAWQRGWDDARKADEKAGEDAREAKQRILDAAQWWADQRELGPRPAKEAWAALAMRIDAELAMLADGYTPQPAAQAAPAVPEGWADAYAAFVGAFDTPQMRRLINDEYSNDARRRLRDLNSALTTQGADRD